MGKNFLYKVKGLIMDDIIEVEIKGEIILKEILYPIDIDSLERLKEEYANIPVIDVDADDTIVAKEFDFVLKGHKRLVKFRTTIEKKRKELKAPAIEYGKSVDSIAKEMQAIIKPIEDKLFIQRRAVEENEAQKQQAVEKAEEERVDKIRGLILNIKDLVLTHYNSDSKTLTEVLESLIIPSEEVFNEFLPEAREVQQVTILKLQEMRKSKISAERADEIEAEREEEAKRVRDEEKAELQADKEKLKQEQDEFEKKKADFERSLQEQQEEKDRLEAERLAEEMQEKQEQEEKEEAKINKNLHDEMVIETMAVLNTYTEMIILVDDIIDGKVPHIKWVKDE